MALESGFTSYISERLTASDTTITIGTAPTVTTGRMRIYNTSGDQEWISFAGVSGNDLTGCVRGLSQTAIPSTGSSTRALEWAPGSYIELVLMHDEITTNDLAVPGRLSTLENHTDTVWTTTGTANTYVLTGVGSAGAYTDIKTILVKFNVTNTGASTIDINGLGVRNIVKNDGSTALVANDIVANEVIQLYNDGTDMVIVGKTVNTLMITSTGSSNAYVLTPATPLGAYYVGHTIEWIANFGNTGATTVNISGLGAKNILKNGGATALASGDIASGSINRIIYDGTQYQIIQPSSAGYMTRGDTLSLITPGGDGTLGNLTASGTVTLTGTDYTVNEYFYNNFTLGANTLTCSTVGAIHIINVAGNLSLASGTVSFNGKGGATAAQTDNIPAVSTVPTTGRFSGGFTATTVGAAHGAGGTYTANANSLQFILGRTVIGSKIGPGTGGGAGKHTPSGVFSAGGVGGGCIVFIVRGNVTLTSSTATVAGTNGTLGTTGGGGGGGGYFGIFYKGTLTGTLTPTVSGGTGATITASYNGGGGCGASANGSNGSGTKGGDGGAGAYDIINMTF